MYLVLRSVDIVFIGEFLHRTFAMNCYGNSLFDIKCWTSDEVSHTELNKMTLIIVGR